MKKLFTKYIKLFQEITENMPDDHQFIFQSVLSIFIKDTRLINGFRHLAYFSNCEIKTLKFCILCEREKIQELKQTCRERPVIVAEVLPIDCDCDNFMKECGIQ